MDVDMNLPGIADAPVMVTDDMNFVSGRADNMDFAAAALVNNDNRWAESEESAATEAVAIPVPMSNGDDFVASPLEQLQGLWVAPYGSHGLEILHLDYIRAGNTRVHLYAFVWVVVLMLT